MMTAIVWSLAFWCSTVAAVNSLTGSLDCDEARMKCAYRSGCARALHSYMMDCADVLAGRTSRCPWSCKRALISLTSTEAGIALSNCECGDNEFCRRSKERAEVCRPEVSLAIAENTVVPCAVAEWICAADHLCSTALEYYHRLCRPMFHGRKCTFRCNNSLAILDRQPKAGKLRSCYCDGTEDFPCISIKKNTQRLCYGREEWEEDTHNFIPTKSGVDSGSETLSPCGLLCIFLCCFVLWTSIDSDHEVKSNPSISITIRKTHSFKSYIYKIKITNHKCLWENLFARVYHKFQNLLNVLVIFMKLLNSFQFARHIFAAISNRGTIKADSCQTISMVKELQPSFSWLPSYQMLRIWPWWWTSENNWPKLDS